jgi:hypothetical protein
MIRSVASFLCWAVAVVAAIATVPTLWVATHVADEDGYVAFTETFVDDVVLRNALIATIVDDAASRGGLPAVARPAVEQALRAVATRSAQQDGFTEAWEESQRRTHRLTFGPDADSDRLTADIGPIAAFVVEQVTKDLPVRFAIPDELVIPIYDAPDRAVIEQVDKTPQRALVGGLVVGLAALLCLVLARRRINAVVGLAAGAIITAGVLLLGTGLALPEVLDRTPARSPFAREMRDLLVDRATDSLNEWLLWTALVGGVVFVLAVLGRALASSASPARRP